MNDHHHIDRTATFAAGLAALVLVALMLVRVAAVVSHALSVASGTMGS